MRTLYCAYCGKELTTFGDYWEKGRCYCGYGCVLSEALNKLKGGLKSVRDK